MLFLNDRLRASLPALFLSVLALSACREARPSSAPPLLDAGIERAASPASNGAHETEGPRVVFLGDSLAAGLHLPADQAFPAVVQRLLQGTGAPFRLVNAGVSGDTTAGGLSRVGWILKQKPRVVVLELGNNDGMRGVPLDRIEQNLRAIIARVRGQGAELLLLGLRLPPSFGADYAAGFAALFERVAKDTGVAFVPFFYQGVAGVPELNLADGIHPTEEGHRRIAEKLAPHLRALLAGLDAGSSDAH
jgi:acyl-CoA thioesterase I